MAYVRSKLVSLAWSCWPSLAVHAYLHDRAEVVDVHLTGPPGHGEDRRRSGCGPGLSTGRCRGPVIRATEGDTVRVTCNSHKGMHMKCRGRRAGLVRYQRFNFPA